ncbi:MAG TPA: DUF167 domain-containing protein [Acidobacteriaceae bacterium]|jgi:uncharacterized protein (TIGR00251 family)|nr:DUF167 domain-containing protein [Acidobacteriaceae bacterium]
MNIVASLHSSGAILRPAPGGCTLSVRVHPGARRNAVTGTHADALKVSLTTPPTQARANAALIAFLAERLRIPRTSIALLTGHTSRSKTLRLAGLTTAEAEALLLPIDVA